MSDTDSGATTVTAPVETASTDADLDTGGQDNSAPDFKEIVLDSQEAADKFVKDRVARATRSAEKKAQTELEALQAKLKAHEDEKLSDAEKLQNAIKAAEKLAEDRGVELTKLQRQNTVRDLALDAKLPRELWDRVRGETEEDIETDIKALAVAFAPTDKEVSVDHRNPTQSPKVTVTPTGGEPDKEANAKSIVDSLDSMPGFRF